MTRICIDTSAYSHFKRGDAAAVSTITRARQIYMPIVVIGELRSGFRQGAHTQKNEQELSQFLNSPIVDVLLVDDETASVYADLVNLLRRAGTPIPTNDIWIASLADRVGATVITYDKHFSLIQRIGVQLLSTVQRDE